MLTNKTNKIINIILNNIFVIYSISEAIYELYFKKKKTTYDIVYDIYDIYDIVFCSI
jgi:hypothetical protein